MTDAERMLLSDAIKTAINAERRAIKWRRACFTIGLFAIVAGVLLVVL